MALKSMALTAEEAKADYGECAPCTSDGDDGPKYPWGLSLCLDQVALDKLGLSLLPVGSEVIIMAKAKITGTSSRERIKGEKREDMDIQITHLEIAQNLTSDERSAKAASKLYGG